MKVFLWILIAALVVAHQDFWNWNDGTLVLGFIPIGLAYHMGISAAAGIVWFMMVNLAWPKQLDEVDSQAVDATENQS
jgi:uncharacterized membrane protein